jgi:hypothetical protein
MTTGPPATTLDFLERWLDTTLTVSSSAIAAENVPLAVEKSLYT